MRLLVLGGMLMLTGCGGGGTTGTNYSDPPPMATIVATPTPAASPAVDNTDMDATDVEAADNVTVNAAGTDSGE